jgi:hypothetical protein
MPNIPVGAAGEGRGTATAFVAAAGAGAGALTTVVVGATASGNSSTRVGPDVGAAYALAGAAAGRTAGVVGVGNGIEDRRHPDRAIFLYKVEVAAVTMTWQRLRGSLFLALFLLCFCK